jgi:hypothetical protein
MNILKIALLCSLRVAFFASLKVALLAYTLFLSDTAFASAVPEGNGNAGDTAFSAGPEGNRHVDRASYPSPEGNRHVGDTASFAAPEGNGHIDVP